MNNALILARNQDKIIAIDGMIPWHNPEDLQYFKAITMRFDYCLMGRKTYESLPKPLPNRKHCVVTSNPKKYDANNKFNNVYFINEKEMWSLLESPDRVICIGGAEIANMVIDFIDTIYLTTIETKIKSDYSNLEVTTWNYMPGKEFKKTTSNYIQDGVLDCYVRGV